MLVKVLIDTNVFIYREESEILPEAHRELERSLNESDATVYMHPLSVREVRNDPDDRRRKRAESRVETYPVVEYPPTPSSGTFRDRVPEASDTNERTDNALLFAVYDGAVDFLITEDRGIHTKARRVGTQDRVFTISEAREYFESDRRAIFEAPDITETTLGELEVSDPIFDSIRADYPDFDGWAEEHGDRTAWVNRTEDGRLGAVLVVKPREVEAIGDDPKLDRERRFKISTFKVAPIRRGRKLGERLLSIAVREAIREDHDKMYLTYYPDGESDPLVQLLASFGFERVSAVGEEALFQKRLVPGMEDDPAPLEMSERFYPSFCDGEKVDKHLVPVKPTFHDKLFRSFPGRQSSLSEFHGLSRSEGNAVRKAYLSHARTKQVDSGDVLLFYRSRDEQAVTSLGVCEDVQYRLSDAGKIQRVVGKRSVFSNEEIRQLVERGDVTVFTFRLHFHLDQPPEYGELRNNDVISGPPRTTQRLDEQGYKYIKQKGGVDGRFARD